MRKKFYVENEILEIFVLGNVINYIIKCKYLEFIDYSV